jgi:hypothetical protein
MYKVIIVGGYGRGTWSQFRGTTPDEKTALSAGRILSLRYPAVYVEKDGAALACFGDAPARREFRRVRYGREKRELLAGRI